MTQGQFRALWAEEMRRWMQDQWRQASPTIYGAERGGGPGEDVPGFCCEQAERFAAWYQRSLREHQVGWLPTPSPLSNLGQLRFLARRMRVCPWCMTKLP